MAKAHLGALRALVLHPSCSTHRRSGHRHEYGKEERGYPRVAWAHRVGNRGLASCFNRSFPLLTMRQELDFGRCHENVNQISWSLLKPLTAADFLC